MAPFNATDYDSMLKEYYSEEQVMRMTLVDNVLLGMLPKKRAGGKDWVTPVNFGHPGGGSADFGVSKTNQYGSKYGAFKPTVAKQYQLITLDNSVYFQSEGGSMEAFEPAFNEFDKGFQGLAQKINRRLYRDTNGTIGQLLDGASISGATLTLVDAADAFNFWAGDKIQFSATPGSTLRDSGDTLEVESVNRETGIITTTSSDVGTDISGLQDTDYIYLEGDWKACPAGLEAWLPVADRTTALSTPFFGVTRSAEPTLLGGVDYDGTSGDLNDTVIKLVGKVGKYGGKPDLVIMNTEQLSNLQRLWLAKQVLFRDLNVTISARTSDGTEIQFTNIYSGMMAQVGQFQVKVLGDRACPSNRLYVLTTSTWRVWHTFDLPGFVMNKEGGRIIRDSEDDDAMECRVGAYFNMACRAPGYNGVAEIPSSI